MRQRHLHLTGIVALLLLTCGLWSRHQGRNLLSVDAVSAATKPGQSVVGIVRSDYQKLKQPAPPDAELSDAQIEEVVRWATAMGGGLQSVIDPRAEWIAIKVNIVELKRPGAGVVTDARVVKAVVKLAHEAAPEARISIVEGSGEWIAPDVPGADTTGAQVEDGWAEAGYRALLADPELAGIELDLVDLNVDEAVLTKVPDQWHAREQFWVPRTVRDCDALIDVPVMKIHDGPGMTCAMKNFVGIAPGLKYGWPKMRGRPGQGPGIPHTPQILDETIVDLTSLANPVFTVVDAIVAMEKDKTERMGGVPVRMNTVIAGSDIVAVDATCARLMGLNPDDLEFITLAAYEGMGRMDEDQITVNGQPVALVARRFERPPLRDGAWSEMGHYGQGNRTWLLKRLAPGETADAQTEPRPGENGWSEPVYFSDDRIDLAKFFDRFKEGRVSGFAEFRLPQAAQAELWLGSDEDLAVWIDGQEVYRFAGARRHHLPNDRVPVAIEAGSHRLLVEVGQTGGRCEFNLNICENEKDPRYEGSRVKGLKFGVPSQSKGMRSVQADEFLKPSAEAKVLDNARWAMNPSTLVGALEGLLKARGDSTLSRAQLMGLTGYAFKLTLSDTLGWDDPGGDGIESDPEAVLRACRPLGHELRMILSNDRQPGAGDSLHAIWEGVRRDLDRGRPAILHQWGCWVIRGYDPQKELYMVSSWDEEAWMPFDEIADHDTGDFGALFVGEHHPVDLRQAGRASLQTALDLSRQADQGNLAHGLRAYERWISALEQDKATDPWAHAFHVELLLGARQAAAAYLDTLASQSEKGPAPHLSQAAAHYRKEVESLQALSQLFGFAPPGQPERVKDPAQRAQGATLLKEALKWEKAALASIEKAATRSQTP
ncbi:MAG: DUF362 domain-containing protein [Candidatus Latescibacteria bacterium]|nr:DUF362 domain-containing protein [Candidatus Latescibacterota bacterium]